MASKIHLHSIIINILPPNIGLSDTISITDAISKDISKLIQDVVILTDSPQFSAARSVSISDSIALSDIISKMFAKSIIDNYILNDVAFGQSNRHFQSISDNIIITTSATPKKQGNAFADAFDTMSLNDTISVVRAIKRTLFDTETINDLIQKTANKTLAQNMSILDSMSRKIGKSLSDILNVNSDTMKKVVLKTLSENIVFSDEISFRFLGTLIKQKRSVQSGGKVTSGGFVQQKQVKLNKSKVKLNAEGELNE